MKNKKFINIILFVILLMERVNKYSKVFINKGNGQKLITVPKYSDIEVGDLVEIKKIVLNKKEEKEDEQEKAWKVSN